jgi:hypothetical protein
MLKIIGAGFGRTGTLSVKAALEALGLVPCYHMTEVFRHPEHAAIWQAAYRGQAVDWEQVFAEYAAAVDWPACTFYEQLLGVYPQAKVLLTVRDPERWYESVRETIYTASRMGGAPPGVPMDVPHMIDALIWQGTFDGAFEDKRRAIAIFEEHNREVQARIPADRLLVYDVKEGWELLCRFLSVAPPAVQPFPHLNDRETFRAMTQRRPN